MEKYRDKGLKLTPQRLAILEYLDGNKSHPSAEDIYAAV
ncbi:MAG: transcriptional repressor, partial [Nitrospiraceae bacterium]